MKILITGDKGFIGRHLRQSLISDGHIVLGIDINKENDRYNIRDINEIHRTRDIMRNFSLRVFVENVKVTG